MSSPGQAASCTIRPRHCRSRHRLSRPPGSAVRTARVGAPSSATCVGPAAPGGAAAAAGSASPSGAASPAGRSATGPGAPPIDGVPPERARPPSRRWSARATACAVPATGLLVSLEEQPWFPKDPRRRRRKNRCECETADDEMKRGATALEMILNRLAMVQHSTKWTRLKSIEKIHSVMPEEANRSWRWRLPAVDYRGSRPWPPGRA